MSHFVVGSELPDQFKLGGYVLDKEYDVKHTFYHNYVL